MAFTTRDRQRIIDDYLAQTGRNMFIAGEFIDWLAERPDHEVYHSFFSMSESDAAREYRIGLARRMASGLRIVARQEVVQASVVQITTREYPAFISPMAGRRSGGGYQPVSPDDPEQMAELQRQGASALRGWLARYRGVFEAAGYDLAAVEKIAAPRGDGVARIA